MASLGAASIRAACEYPVGNAGDCFREAEVGGGVKDGLCPDSGSPALSEDSRVTSGSGILGNPYQA